MRLAGKRALITGGNSGIGLATASLFVAEGAQIVITGRDQGSLDAALSRLGPAASGVQADLTASGTIDSLFKAVAERFGGGLDIVFANAGVAQATPLGATTDAALDAIYDVNVKAVFLTVQQALPLLGAGASVILNGSVVSVMGTPHFAAYAASKAAVRALARSFAAELAPCGIRVNVVSPGPIQTPIWGRSPSPAAVRQAAAARIGKSLPAGRWGTADEVAKAVLYLASDEASFTYGAELVVDGGMSGLPSGAPAYRDEAAHE